MPNGKTAGSTPIEIAFTRLGGAWKPEDQMVIQDALYAALGFFEIEAPLEISVALANDARVRELNKHYRKQDKPTNVLSFENGESDERGTCLLGDIVLALETCRREAKETGKSFKDHLSHLSIHGLLHLFGYDHIEEEEAHEMEAFEGQILEEMGIENPYLDKSTLNIAT